MATNLLQLFTDIPELQLAVMTHCCERKTVCLERMNQLSSIAEDYIKLVLRNSQYQTKTGEIVAGSVEHAVAIYSIASLVPQPPAVAKKTPSEKKSTPLPRKKVSVTPKQDSSMANRLRQNGIPDNIVNTISAFHRTKKRINFITCKDKGYVYPIQSTTDGDTPNLHEKCGICDIIRKSGKRLTLHDSILAVSAHCKGFSATLASIISRVVTDVLAERELYDDLSRKKESESPTDGGTMETQ